MLPPINYVFYTPAIEIVHTSSFTNKTQTMSTLKNSRITVFILILISVSILSCTVDKEPSAAELEQHKLLRKSEMEQKMKQHLDAVTNRDLISLKSTLHPDGKMQLILPGTDIINGVDGFMEFHSDWFSADDEWTFETKILNSEVGENFGMVITELTYREPERDGKPYFNRQTVSYVLEDVDGEWYVIKDHCSSTEKSTD